MPATTAHPPRFGSEYSPAVGKVRTALEGGAHRLARLAAAGGDPAALLAHALGIDASGALADWLRRAAARAEGDAFARVLRRVGPARVRSLGDRLRDASTWTPLDPPAGWLRRDLARALDVTHRTSAGEVVARLGSAGVAVGADDPAVAALLAEGAESLPT